MIAYEKKNGIKINLNNFGEVIEKSNCTNFSSNDKLDVFLAGSESLLQDKNLEQDLSESNLQNLLKVRQDAQWFHGAVITNGAFRKFDGERSCSAVFDPTYKKNCLDLFSENPEDLLYIQRAIDQKCQIISDNFVRESCVKLSNSYLLNVCYSEYLSKNKITVEFFNNVTSYNDLKK